MINDIEDPTSLLKRLAKTGKIMLTGKEIVDLGLVGSQQTLRNWRWKGEWIRYYKVGGRIVYSIHDIISYLKKNKVEPK
ncbi:MAG: helix-turn-helix domain-containing protein [Planctomycetota bacterium]|jgi:hypothetical protein